ncbi:cytochrome p450 [Trifolium pratense]|uniref:Cytochrome p450 n=1 Tax=Trifolium pratense TaxID=57577 RepID=A0A2K3N788_TRIPR|nr:cytochrome p450 [Trifolium pratense]
MDVLYTLLTFIAFSFLAIFIAICFIMMPIFKGKSIGNPKYAPVKGTVFNQLFYFNKLHDYHTQMAKTHSTFRFLAPNHSKYNQDIITDLFGEGIFAVDGDKWKQQRKVASYEFSTRVLRDFSCSVFRENAAKLVKVIAEFSHEGLIFDMQDLQMRCALDSIFKVGFGTELNCLEGSSKEGTEFMKAFDESNALIYWRYADPIWSLKRFLNIGGEAKLKRNVKLIDEFVNGVINTKKEQLALHQDYFAPPISGPPDRLIWFGGSVLASSGSSPLPIAVAGYRNVVIPTKSSVDHH